MSRLTIFATAASLVLFLYILEMVRRRKLREEYSIIWLAGSIVIFALVTRKDWLDWASRAVGIYYPPSFLFLVGMLLILLILIHYSIVISRLHAMNKRMAQEIALLKSRLDDRGPGAGGADREPPKGEPCCRP